ncbi:MAG: carboxypeptidase regulatory-like domain-containing protein [Planctomycetales bacterium]|nr:carboxypeptidase regulatory-like domain-containing protein [Planctomycetales bacterium]
MDVLNRISALFVCLSLLALGCQRDAPTSSTNPARITGRVVSNSNGQPIAGASVRIKGATDFALTTADGSFQLGLPKQLADHPPSTRVTASQTGYLIEGVDVLNPADNTQSVEIRLAPLPNHDNLNYVWTSPHPDPVGEFNCANCHAEMYREWQTSGHASSATNQRFINLYEGSTARDNVQAGWSLLDELPEGAGVCLACHAPSAPLEELGIGDVREVTGTVADGVHCDYCHKVQTLANETQLGLTHGRFAASLLRPTEGQLFFGPLDDVDRGEDSMAPFETESRFCAACHEGTVFGVPVYTTYSEWLASRAAATNRTCQSCHMRPTGQMTNIAPGHGGIDRDPSSLASHAMLPGGRLAMLRDCVEVTTDLAETDSRLQVTVRLRTHDVGHRVPTGFIDRHLILAVEAFDHDHQAVAPQAGTLLTDAAGELAGLAGMIFAKQLTDADGVTPAPFWRGGSTWTDSRLEPDGVTDFVCAFPSNANVIRVKLIYRPFWAETIRDKHWPDSSLIIHETRHEWTTRQP